MVGKVLKGSGMMFCVCVWIFVVGKLKTELEGRSKG